MLLAPALLTAMARAQTTTPTLGMVLPSSPSYDSATMTLTMDQAVVMAQLNNPSYLETVATRRSASAALRSAHGGLLPQLSALLTGAYQQGGQQIVSGSALNINSNVLESEYNVGLTYTTSAQTILAPRQARASLAAANADIASARETLQENVRQHYLTVLQDDARVGLQDTLVENARAQLELAKGRASVGSGTALDMQRAEVALGQQQVQQLQARNQATIDRLRLFQQIGVPAPPHVILTSMPTSEIPVPSLDALIAMTHQQNPVARALQQRVQAAAVGVSMARAAYLPILSLSTGIGGQTYQFKDPNFLVTQQQEAFASQQQSCLQQQQLLAAVGLSNDPSQCAAFALTPTQAAAIRSQNNVFPFHFTSIPRSVSLSVSLPLFDGFQREQHIQEADVQWDNTRAQERDNMLSITADVTAAYLTLQSDQQTVAMQTQNAAKARQELKLTQDQYAVGLSTFVDLATSVGAYAQAENDRITAIYDYQKALAALESAVGRPLR
ncbi:MAG TPA: TolC family protein [Gemmatimonadaceae bacterium]|nr:TolC family protein [Gemmatimonadaceae bacterium]